MSGTPRRRDRRIVFVASAWLASGALASGCGALRGADAQPSAPQERAADEPRPSSAATSDEAREGAHEGAREPTREPPPSVRVEVRGEGDRTIVSLTNDTAEPVRFASRVVFEAATAEPGAGGEPLQLELSPGQALAPCASLVTGATLELTAPSTLGAGAHRLVVASCDGTSRVESEPFFVSSSGAARER